MAHTYKIPLMLTAQPEGGYTVTSPALPELITEGNTVEEASPMCRMPWLLWSSYTKIWASHCRRDFAAPLMPAGNRPSAATNAVDDCARAL